MDGTRSRTRPKRHTGGVIGGALTLTVVAQGKTENNASLEPGMVVDYLGHVPGGDVSIRRNDGKKDIAHPMCFKELR